MYQFITKTIDRFRAGDRVLALLPSAPDFTTNGRATREEVSQQYEEYLRQHAIEGEFTGRTDEFVGVITDDGRPYTLRMSRVIAIARDI